MIKLHLSVFVISLLVSMVSTIHATDRILPGIIVDDGYFSMNLNPLEQYWADSNSRPAMRPIDSAFGEYKCLWTITDETLVLSDFQATSEMTGEVLGIADIFGRGVSAKATWFTGTILLAEGELGTGAFGRVTAVKMIVIEDGKVIKTLEHPPTIFDVEGRIGLGLRKDGESIVVQSIATGSPVERLEVISAGDIIHRIESDEWGLRELDSLSLNKVVAMIRGPQTSKVLLHIERKDKTRLTVEVLRNKKSLWTSAR